MKKIITLFSIMLAAVFTAQPSGWLYNQPITVTNNNTVNAVNYQLMITVNTQSLISNNQMLANGNDIRFAGSCTGGTFYNYWIEGGINTATTAIWVKIPMIAANTSSTIFMFYGNSVAAAASTIQGTFRGPNSSTDSVTGGTSGGLLVCQRGFRFNPNQNLLVTHFGKYEPAGTTRYVTLFNYATQAILTQTQVSGPSATYSYGPIPAPLWLNQGTQYVLQIYGLATDGYYYGTSSQIGQHLTYIDMQYSNGGTQNTFPTNSLNNIHYGYGDFLYYVTNTLAIIPTYSFVPQIGSITGPTGGLCSGNSVTLTTNATGSFSWSTGSTASVIVVSPTTNTVYYLSSATNTFMCPAISLTVNSVAPTIAIASSTTQTCLGKSVVLTASGALTYTWTGGITNGVAFSPGVTTTYSVTGTNGCGSTTSSITITVAPLPITAATSNSLICSQNPATLTASGATSYTWMPGNLSSGTVIVSPYSTTLYTVTASDGTCQGVATVMVNTKPNPTITVAASSSIICDGDNVTITANGADTYTWNPPVITGSTGVVSPTAPVNYQVSGSNSVGCISNSSQIVIVNPLPNVIASVNPSLICNGNSAMLIASGTANSYTWNTGSSLSPLAVSPSVTTTYTLTGDFTATGCFKTSIVTVNVYQPVLPVSPSTVVCRGSAITLTAGAGTNYAWSNGSVFSAITVTPNVATVYSVSAMTSSNNINCLSSNTVEVTINDKPVVTATGTRTIICRFEKTTLTASGALTYTWNNVPGNSSLTFSSNIAILHNFSVVGSDANGCRDTANIQVKVNTCTDLQQITTTGNLIHIYPNPNEGAFIIRSSAAIELKLMNELGQVIKNFNLDGTNDYQANIKELAKGIYFITGESENGIINQKILVEK